MNERVTPIAKDAADIMIAAVREAGLDPWKAGQTPMIQERARAWLRGEMDRPSFIRCCQNMLVFQPHLAALPVVEQKMRVERLDIPEAGR